MILLSPPVETYGRKDDTGHQMSGRLLRSILCPGTCRYGLTRNGLVVTPPSELLEAAHMARA